MPVSAERAAEFNRLLVEQGTATRSMKYGWKPTDEEKAEIDARAVRLIELAELAGITAGQTPERYVNERLASWLTMNPLVLEIARVKRIIENYEGQDVPLEEVRVQIGDVDKGYAYRVMADDLQLSFQSAKGVIVLKVPDSVAEHFRQQGRRSLQREFAALIAVPSKV